MKTKLLFIWELLKTNFWFIPLLLILAAVVVAFGFVYLDSQLSYQPEGVVGYFFSGGVESARNILSTIAGAMLSVAGTVFSITLVALTLASSQFGSRLLRNFMHDRLNQVVLGTYIATFTYCLLVLRTVNSSTALTFVPNLSVLAAILFSIGNILLLVIFIHHVAVSIQADNVISDISNNLQVSIKELFPDQLGSENDQIGIKEAKSQKAQRTVLSQVRTNKSGYLQAIDSDSLFSSAKERDLFLILNYRPGDFLVQNEVLLSVKSTDKLNEQTLTKIREAFIIRDQRTPIQDAEFAIHQLVEVASRALSPGINDPFTAITCIDKLTETMCVLTQTKFPSAYRIDGDDRIRVEAKTLNFSGMMDASFSQIRQYAKDNPAVLIRLIEAFIKIQCFIDGEKAELEESVAKHARMVLHTAEKAGLHPNDLADVQSRFDTLGIKNENGIFSI